MTGISDDWYLDGRQILHACARDVQTRWNGGRRCVCGVAVPRRVERFHHWIRGGERRGPVLILAVLRAPPANPPDDPLSEPRRRSA